jgi:ABC-2 type transport system ATP-binding protein
VSTAVLAAGATRDRPAGDATAVATAGLTKRFGKQVAVDHVSLDVPSGAVYGFLGPNGSGKTTTIRMLLGLVTPHAGDVRLLGRPMPTQAAAVLPRVGALIEGPAFLPYLSGRDNLRRLDAADATADPATSRARIDAALDRVGLLHAAKKRYRAYSLGMRQRLGLAAALLQPRDLLVLDEPTNGLDPQGTREVRTLIRELSHDGTTVLVSSHLLAEVEQVCTHVGIMSAGRLLRQGSLAELTALGAHQVYVTTPDPDAASRTLARLGVTDLTRSAGPDGDPTVTGLAGTGAIEDVVRALVADGVPVRGVGATRPTLEELFVSLTGEGFDVAG